MDVGARPEANGRTSSNVCASLSLRLFRSTSAPALDVVSPPAAVPQVVSVDSSSDAMLLSRIEGVNKWDVAVPASRMRASTVPKGLQVRRFEKLLLSVFISCRPPSRLCFVYCLGIWAVFYAFYSVFTAYLSLTLSTFWTHAQTNGSHVPASTDNPAAGSIRPHHSVRSLPTLAMLRPRLPARRFPMSKLTKAFRIQILGG